jgi:hypothetical protein
MKNGIKYLVAGLVATGITVGAYATITVNANTAFNAFVTDNTGANNYLSGDLVEIGSFASAPTVGSPSLAGFTVFGSTLTGTGASAGVISAALTGPDGVWTHNQIYLVTFNAATVGAATQEGIFDVGDASNSKWKFPATADTLNTTSIDVQDLFLAGGSASLATGAQVVFGGVGTDPSGPFSLAETATIVPEPSTWMLVGTGLIGLLGLRRRRS